MTYIRILLCLIILIFNCLILKAENIHTENTLKEIIIKELKRDLPDDSEITIEFIKREDLNPVINLKDLKCEIEFSYTNPVKVTFYGYFNNKLQKKILYLNIKIYTNVVVAENTILSGNKINRNNITIKRKNIMNLNGMPYFKIDETILNKIVNKTIQKDRVITKNDFEMEKDIKVGRIVKIIYETDGVSISADGRAEQNGDIGEIIGVRNLKSKKLIYGKVISEKTVKVEVN